MAALKAAFVLLVQRSGSIGTGSPSSCRAVHCSAGSKLSSSSAQCSYRSQSGARLFGRAQLFVPVRGRRNGTGDWRNGTRSRRYWRCVAATASSACARTCTSSSRSRASSDSSCNTRPHPFEVQPRRGQLLNVAQALQVLVGEAPAPPARAGRIEQALALVDAQRLRVHPRQLGRHRDHIDRLVRVTVRHHCITPLLRPTPMPSTPPPRSAAPAPSPRPATPMPPSPRR